MDSGLAPSARPGMTHSSRRHSGTRASRVGPESITTKRVILERRSLIRESCGYGFRARAFGAPRNDALLTPSFRDTRIARGRGIHNHETRDFGTAEPDSRILWIWIPGSRLRRAPE